MTKKAHKEKKEIVITFRLSESEYAPYKKLINDSGFKKSRVMREIFIAKAGNTSLPKTQTKDNKRLVFLANKTSNNINQLARKLNAAYKDGTVNANTYTLLLNNLINVERSFFNAIKKC